MRTALHSTVSSLAPLHCTRKPSSRTLVQRTRLLGANLPNDFLLTTSGPLSAGLEEQLRKVADEFSEELFEFEGKEGDVAVYWTEWGGVDKVRRLHYHLERLAAY